MTAIIASTDVGVPITGVVTSGDASVDLTTVTGAKLIISGVGSKTAIVTSTTTTSAHLKWLYDGTLTSGTYPCWWQLTFASGVRTAPSGSSMALQVFSVS